MKTPAAMPAFFIGRRWQCMSRWQCIGWSGEQAAQRRCFKCGGVTGAKHWRAEHPPPAGLAV
ncbi:hypothetical protein FHR53_001073 [Xanthomonas arboricola]|uniref:hypothetical protein n=1 Tax=Xanthomonas cannabis TaxID=1885674 RepID=UPI0011110CD7